MKKLLYLLLLLPTFVWAGQKLTSLNQTTTPSTTDYMYIVTNSSSMKVTPASLFSLPGTSTSYILVISSNNFIQNRKTLQAGSTFYTSSGTVTNYLGIGVQGLIPVDSGYGGYTGISVQDKGSKAFHFNEDINGNPCFSIGNTSCVGILEADGPFPSNVGLVLDNATTADVILKLQNSGAEIMVMEGLLTGGAAPNEVKFTLKQIANGDKLAEFQTSSSSGAYMALYGKGGAANYVALKASDTIGSSFFLTLPASLGTAGQFIKTDVSGNLSFATITNSAAFAVSTNSVVVSSPTTNINFMPPFKGSLNGTTTAQITLDASSVTLQANNFNGASQLIQTNSSSFVPNANLDGSSITKAGILVAGSNITIAYGVGVTTITGTASGGGVSVYPATSTIQANSGITTTTMTFTGSVFSTSTGTLKSSAGIVSVSTYALVGSIGISFDGAGSSIVAGSTRAITIPYDCTISSWTVLADQSGSISVDVKRSTFAGYPSISSLVGSGNKPSLTSVQKNAATPSSWTVTYINAGDSVAFVVDSASTITWVSVILWVTKL